MAERGNQAHPVIYLKRCRFQPRYATEDKGCAVQGKQKNAGETRFRLPQRCLSQFFPITLLRLLVDSADVCVANYVNFVKIEMIKYNG